MSLRKTVYFILPIRKLLRAFVWGYNFWVSLWFNLTMLPFKQGIKMPIWLHLPRFVNIDRMCRTCRISIEAENISFGMIKLGVRYNSWNPYNGIKLQLYGDVIFKGSAVIGNASTLYVANDSCLILGENFIAASGLVIVCQKKIQFGSDSLIGWNCQFYDTDFHKLTNAETGTVYEKKATIIIGRNNWIGCHSVFFKGFKSTDDIVISAYSICKKRVASRKKSIIGDDNQLSVLSENIFYDARNDM